MLVAAQLRFASGTDGLVNVLVIGDSQGREISAFGHMHILTQQTTASRLRAKLPDLVRAAPTFRFDWLGARRWGSCVFPTDEDGAEYWVRSGTDSSQRCTLHAGVAARRYLERALSNQTAAAILMNISTTLLWITT